MFLVLEGRGMDSTSAHTSYSVIVASCSVQQRYWTAAVLLRSDSGTTTDLRTAGYLVIDLLQGAQPCGFCSSLPTAVSCELATSASLKKELNVRLGRTSERRPGYCTSLAQGNSGFLHRLLVVRSRRGTHRNLTLPLGLRNHP
jgi:hypothetical protein